MMRSILRLNIQKASTIFLVIFLSSLLLLPVQPVQAEEPHAEMVWVLTDTTVNPAEAGLEFYGGGTTPNWFPEARFEGMHLKYGVTETSFRVEDRFVDHGYEYHDVTIETFFEKPSNTLTPGETVELIVGFAHSGSEEDGGIGVSFWYQSEDVNISPDYAYGYAPWSDEFDGKTETTFTFEVPPATSGGELEITAGLWNHAPCHVVWTYTARETDPDEFQEPEVIGEIEIDPEDYVSSPDTLAGQVVALVGDVTVISSGQEKPLFRSDQIWLGSCIKTGDRGRVRIRMNDVTVDDLWVDQQIPGNTEYIREVYREQGNINPALSRVRGPSYINIGRNSQMCFHSMRIDYRQDKPYFSGLVGLIEGQIRAAIRGWDENAAFDVRAGIAICGIRGSDVMIQYDPEQEFVQGMVYEGHLDVTLQETGETKSFYDRSSFIISAGDLNDLGELDEETWDRYIEDFGLTEEDLPDTEFLELEEIQDRTPQPSDQDDGMSFEANRINPLLPIVVMVGIFVLCTIFLILIIVVVFLLVRKRSANSSDNSQVRDE